MWSYFLLLGRTLAAAFLTIWSLFIKRAELIHSTVCDDLGCNVICWCWSIVFFENQRHCTRLPIHFGALPSADQLFKDADFIFQHDLAPAHTPKSTKSWLNDHGFGVLVWPANSPGLNPVLWNFSLWV